MRNAVAAKIKRTNRSRTSRLNAPYRVRNGPAAAGNLHDRRRTAFGGSALAAHSQWERVTGIEPALPAWEAVLSGLPRCSTCGAGYP